MLALHRDLDVVIGVDTHNNNHTAAAVGATGAVLEHLTVPADPAGYSQLIGFGRRHDARLWAIEGTGSFGAGLTTAHRRCKRQTHGPEHRLADLESGLGSPLAVRIPSARSQQKKAPPGPRNSRAFVAVA